jgi:hypothetical protein
MIGVTSHAETLMHVTTETPGKQRKGDLLERDGF